MKQTAKYNIKHFLRFFLDHLTVTTGLLQWYERRMRRGLTILVYHRILPLVQCVDYPLPSLVIPVEVFRQQMQWLSVHCRVLPVWEALADLPNGSFAKPLVAVTFDDGYYDNFTLAAPALEENGVRGTFFVTSGFSVNEGPQWYDRAALAWQNVAVENRRVLLDALRGAKGERTTKDGDQERAVWMAELKRAVPAKRMELVARAESLVERPLDFSRYQPMCPEQVAALHARGHEIASHTVSHPILPQLTDELLAAELHDSAKQLEAMTGGARVAGFCYPNGDYDLRVENAVAQAGYRYACTIEEGINQADVCPTRLTRLPITMQRTMGGPYQDLLGFRSELSRLRALWRR